MTGEFLRYVANGLCATAVHYGVLEANMHLFNFSSAGLANLVAAVAGIAASFAGNRWFVFRAAHAPLLAQASRFALIYAALALLHGGLMYGWADVAGFNYRLGFLLATGVQFALSYAFNRQLVFQG